LPVVEIGPDPRRKWILSLHHLSIFAMDLKFQCLSTVVSLMSEEDFQNLLPIRQEKNRIAMSIADSQRAQLKSVINKIK